MQVARDLPQVGVDDGHAVATREREYSLVPLTASAEGCRPTSIRPKYASVPSSKTRNCDTVLPPQADTNTWPSAVSEMP